MKKMIEPNQNLPQERGPVNHLLLKHQLMPKVQTTLTLYRRCLLIPKYFCAVNDCALKADLSKSYWNPKRKLGVTAHFSEIIEH